MKIDLAKPQPADCHLFEARVNKDAFSSSKCDKSRLHSALIKDLYGCT
jgi:hypothetical protein